MKGGRSDAMNGIGELGYRRRPRGQQNEAQPDSSTLDTTMSFRDDELDEEFPLGDGTVETSATVSCPYCGEINEIGLDPGSGSEQEYVEDCQVCCRAWHVTVVYLPDGSAEVSVEPENLS